MAEYKVVDAEQLDADLTEIADEVRILTDTIDTMTIDEITSNIAQVNTDVEAQADIIAQIQAALNGKVGSNAAEIGALIDQSGVLDSIDGTAMATITEKVKQLIHATDLFFKLYGINFYGSYSVERIEFYIDWVSEINFQFAKSLYFLRGIDATKLTTCRNMFAQCTALETIEIPFDMSKHNAYNMEYMFSGCVRLIDVGFVDESIKESIVIPSPMLTIGNVFDLTDTENVGSVQSIINGLATLAEGAAAQTLTLSQNLPLTEEQKQAITTAANNKGWTLAFT